MRGEREGEAGESFVIEPMQGSSVDLRIVGILVPHAPTRRVAPVPRSRTCHKHCGRKSDPVINGVVHASGQVG